jgi:hypothetical protein
LLVLLLLLPLLLLGAMVVVVVSVDMAWLWLERGRLKSGDGRGQVCCQFASRNAFLQRGQGLLVVVSVVVGVRLREVCLLIPMVRGTRAVIRCAQGFVIAVAAASSLARLCTQATSIHKPLLVHSLLRHAQHPTGPTPHDATHAAVASAGGGAVVGRLCFAYP